MISTYTSDQYIHVYLPLLSLFFSPLHPIAPSPSIPSPSSTHPLSYYDMGTQYIRRGTIGPQGTHSTNNSNCC